MNRKSDLTKIYPTYPNNDSALEPQVDCSCSEETEPPLSPSLYHPKKKYIGKGVLISKKDIHQAENEEPSSSHSSIYPPSTLVFTEDLMFSNFDWGVRSGDVNSPPSTIQFSDDF